jgi:hypothetical protein
VRWWIHTIKALWRIKRGRWYVLRDVPTDVVRRIAALSFKLRSGEDVPDDVRTLIAEAKNESKLRKRRSKL